MRYISTFINECKVKISTSNLVPCCVPGGVPHHKALSWTSAAIIQSSCSPSPSVARWRLHVRCQGFRLGHAEHIFLLQVEQVVDGVVDSLRKARHRHFVGLVGARLREPDIHLNTRTTGENQTRYDTEQNVNFSPLYSE